VKKILLVLAGVLFMLNVSGLVSATVIQYDGGSYQTPDGWGVIASVSPIDLSHDSYYLWDISDLSADTQLQQVNIVFHGIHDWYYGEQDWLNVYLKDSHTASLGWSVGGNDGQSTASPDWSLYTGLGEWSDPYGGPCGSPPNWPVTYDVVFTIEGNLLTYLMNGGTFTIGIDPDCHYWGDKITVEAPVPEPATVLLLGIGLLGIGLFGRKKITRSPF